MCHFPIPLTPRVTSDGKRLNHRRLACDPSASTEVQDTEAGARSLGLQLHMVNTTQESEFERAFAAIVAKRVAGLLVGDDPFLQSRRDQIVQLAARHAIPAIYFSRDFPTLVA